MHMSHVYHPRRWNSPQHPPARRTLEHLDRFGAYIVLTERQREDVETAYGQRSNLFVLPNPGRPVDPPSPLPPRDPNLFVVIARLERVKRVDDAIRAFATVSAQAPRARLDIYGEGRQRAACQALIEDSAWRLREVARSPTARTRQALGGQRPTGHESVRGISAGDPRSAGPWLPGRQLRHQVRAPGADRRRRDRVPRPLR